jgi:hypothetical protein
MLTEMCISLVTSAVLSRPDVLEHLPLAFGERPGRAGYPVKTAL